MRQYCKVSYSFLLGHRGILAETEGIKKDAGQSPDIRKLTHAMSFAPHFPDELRSRDDSPDTSLGDFCCRSVAFSWDSVSALFPPVPSAGKRLRRSTNRSKEPFRDDVRPEVSCPLPKSDRLSPQAHYTRVQGAPRLPVFASSLSDCARGSEADGVLSCPATAPFEMEPITGNAFRRSLRLRPYLKRIILTELT